VDFESRRESRENATEKVNIDDDDDPALATLWSINSWAACRETEHQNTENNKTQEKQFDVAEVEIIMRSHQELHLLGNREDRNSANDNENFNNIDLSLV